MDAFYNWENTFSEFDGIYVFKANLLHLEVVCFVMVLSDPQNLASDPTGIEWDQPSLSAWENLVSIFPINVHHII